MRSFVLLSLLALLGCGAKEDPEGFTITGKLGGYDLASELRSGILQTVEDRGERYTVVTLSSLPDLCTSLKQVGSCFAGDTSKRQLVIKVKGAAITNGNYLISETDPFMPTGQRAGVVFISLNRDCTPAAKDVVATSGEVWFTKYQPYAEGKAAFRVFARTPEGLVEAKGNVPFCKL